MKKRIMSVLLALSLALAILPLPARAEGTSPTEAPAPTETSAPTEAPAPTETSAPTEAPAPTETSAPTEAPAQEPTQPEEVPAAVQAFLDAVNAIVIPAELNDETGPVLNSQIGAANAAYDQLDPSDYHREDVKAALVTLEKARTALTGGEMPGEDETCKVTLNFKVYDPTRFTTASNKLTNMATIDIYVPAAYVGTYVNVYPHFVGSDAAGWVLWYKVTDKTDKVVQVDTATEFVVKNRNMSFAGYRTPGSNDYDPLQSYAASVKADDSDNWEIQISGSKVLTADAMQLDISLVDGSDSWAFDNGNTAVSSSVTFGKDAFYHYTTASNWVKVTPAFVPTSDQEKFELVYKLEYFYSFYGNINYSTQSSEGKIRTGYTVTGRDVSGVTAATQVIPVTWTRSENEPATKSLSASFTLTGDGTAVVYRYDTLDLTLNATDNGGTWSFENSEASVSTTHSFARTDLYGSEKPAYTCVDITPAFVESNGKYQLTYQLDFKAGADAASAVSKKTQTVTTDKYATGEDLARIPQTTQTIVLDWVREKQTTGNLTSSASFALGDPSYTISFDAQGHGTAPASQTIIRGEKIAKPDSLTEAYYEFGGWYTDAACTTAWNFETDTVSDDLTLYAKWTWTHTHGSWTYSASGATLIAACGAAGCTETPYSEALTLCAPANLTYDGTGKSATLSSREGLQSDLKTNTAILYSNGNDTSENAPIDAGTYTARISVQEATAALEFTIAKAALTAPANPAWDRETLGKATWEAVPNATSYLVQLYKDNEPVGSSCSVEDDTYYTFGSFQNPEAGSYTFRVYACATSNFIDSPEVTSPALNLCSVTVTQGAGYTVTPQSGSASPVLSGGSYSFTVTIGDSYETDSSFAVKSNDTVLTPAEGVYTISGITENQTITVQGVSHKDKVVPNVVITQGDNTWNTFQSDPGFRYFYKTARTVTITAGDSGANASGVVKTEYYLSNIAKTKEQLKDVTWTAYTGPITLERYLYENYERIHSGEYIVYARATDGAGNQTIVCSDGIVVYQDPPKSLGTVEHAYQDDYDPWFLADMNGNEIASITRSDGTAVDYACEHGACWLEPEDLKDLLPGEYTLTVTCKPRFHDFVEGEAPGTTTITLIVGKTAPDITWPTAGTITYGQPLSESALTGGSTEYGTFAWTDPEKVLTAGEQTASVTFTPSEEALKDYSFPETTNMVTITVDKKPLTVKADDFLVHQGNVLPDPTYTVTGLVGNDTFIATTYEGIPQNANTAGTYSVTISGTLINADSYAVTYETGDLVVSDHQWADLWTNDSGYHWHICLVPGCPITENSGKNSYGAHTDADNNGICDECEYFMEIAQVQTQTKKTELTQVPEELAGIYGSVAEIDAALSRVLTTNTGFPAGNMDTFDVTLQFSVDGGSSWLDATEANFPAGGITVILPYPAGTGRDTHDFQVTHMFTTTSAKLGTIAGATEQPAVTKLEGGIRVTLRGLSPVGITWKAIPTSAEPSPIAEKIYDTDCPKTGDTTHTGLWLGMAAVGLLGLTVTMAAKKRCRRR